MTHKIKEERKKDRKTEGKKERKRGRKKKKKKDITQEKWRVRKIQGSQNMLTAWNVPMFVLFFHMGGFQ